MDLTSRMKRRVARDYREEDRETVESILVELMESLKEGIDKERIIGATLLQAEAQLDRLPLAVRVAKTDWRDILMDTGLEHGDWRARLDAEFGSSS